MFICFLFRVPKKLLITAGTVAKRSKGKKCHLLEGNHQGTEVNALLPQSRRETRNSAKAAALQKQKEESPEEIIKDNKRKLMYILYSCINFRVKYFF